MASSVVVPLLLLLSSALLSLCVAAAAAAVEDTGTCPPPERENRIISGVQMNITEAPWMAAVILDGSRQHCGGTVISSRHVLSAAHCYENKKEDRLTVRLGSTYHNSGGTVYQVQDIFKGGLWKCQRDIAILVTKTPIVFGAGVAAARLPDAGSPDLPVGTRVMVAGWGDINSGKETTRLMGVVIKVVDFAECKDQPQQYPDEKVNICAGGDYKENPCKGDSGGPLVLEGTDLLVGIVSCGFCSPGASIFTKVAAFRDWIKEHAGV